VVSTTEEEEEEEEALKGKEVSSTIAEEVSTTKEEKATKGEEVSTTKAEEVSATKAKEAKREKIGGQSVSTDAWKKHSGNGTKAANTSEVSSRDAETMTCSATGVSFEPMDMAGQGLTIEDDAAACQARCAAVDGCAHFSFYKPLKHCHIQDPFAAPKGNRPFFIAGPPTCSGSQVTSKITEEILLKKEICFEPQVSYMPMDMRGHRPTKTDTILDCEKLCAEQPRCAHFVWNVLDRHCHLADFNARQMKRVLYHVAGPPECQKTVSISMMVHNVDLAALSSNETLLKKTKEAIADAVMGEAGRGITKDAMGVAFMADDALNLRKLATWFPWAHSTSSGSFLAHIQVRPPLNIEDRAVQQRLTSSSLTKAVAIHLGAVPGIAKVSTGDIRVGMASQVTLGGSGIDTQRKFLEGRSFTEGTASWAAGALAAAAVVTGIAGAFAAATRRVRRQATAAVGGSQSARVGSAAAIAPRSAYEALLEPHIAASPE